jgi:hypothetical protein
VDAPPTNPHAHEASPSHGDRTRPRSVSIFGILNIAFGGLGLLLNLGDLVASLFGSGGEGPAVGRSLSGSGVMWGWALAWSSTGLVASGVLIASGVDLRRGRCRGLWLAVDYALFYGIFTSCVGVVVTLLFGFLPLFEAFQRTRSPDRLAEAISQLIFVLLQAGLSAIYSIILLTVLRRPAVIASLS